MKKIRRALLNLTRFVNAKTLPIAIFGIVLILNFAFAEDIGDLSAVFMGLACSIKTLLVPIGFLLVVAAAVIYAGGQIGSAEMRAKAQGWAVWALVGAIIAFVISILGPALIAAMYSSSSVDIDACCDAGCSLSETGIETCRSTPSCGGT